MKPNALALVIAVPLSAALLLNCKSKAPAPSPAPSPSASAASAALPPRVDPAFLELLGALGKRCKVDADAGSVACDGSENRSLSAEFQSGKRKRAGALPTLTHALGSSEPTLRAVAAHLLNTAFRMPWLTETEPGAVEPEDAKALLAAAVKLPNALARQAVPGAVHAMMVSGSTTETYALLDQADAAEIRPLGYRYIMTLGRLGAFPKVQELVKDPSIALVFAALEAPRNMYDWSEAEKSAICPWAAEILKDTRPNVPSRAAALLGNCGGEFVDALLERGEQALKAGQFNAGELGSYRDLCGAAALKAKDAPNAKQCERNRKLLTDVVNAKKVDAQTRGLALVSVAYQWPDAKTAKLAQSLEKSSDKVLAERAAGIVKRLEQRKTDEAKK